MPRDPVRPFVPHLLEVAQVAHRLSVSQEFVRQRLRTKQLAAVRLGGRWRVDAADLQAYIDARRVVADLFDGYPGRAHPEDRRCTPRPPDLAPVAKRA